MNRPQVFLSFVLLGARFPWIWYHTGVSFWDSTFWTLHVTCLFLFLFWSRSLPLSESDLTHYGCCVGVVKAFCKLLVFDCHYCARYWKLPIPFHSHQVSFAFMWQKFCARVKPPCLFWYLLPFETRAIFRTHSSRGQKTLSSHLNFILLYTLILTEARIVLALRAKSKIEKIHRRPTKAENFERDLNLSPDRR